MADRPTIAILVSLDTKAAEAAFLRDEIVSAGAEALLVDFGTGAAAITPDVSAEQIAELGGTPLAQLRDRQDRNAAIETMMVGVAAWAASARTSGQISGIISIGGSGGTAVGTAAMRALPFGAPKVMVSTVAASDVRDYVGSRDITMVNAVVDFAGVNPISEPVLRNAAAAAAAMAIASQRSIEAKGRLVAVSQFGVTTRAVEQIQPLLAGAGLTLVPFHATGIGGRTMEALIAEGLFIAVLDLTTTEWADEIAGGNLSAGPTRLEAAARAGLPQVVVPGALDMANFFMVPVPEALRHRTLFHHNANVTLMRTTQDENAEIGRRIAEKLNAATGPVTVLFPLRGLSALDAEGQPFHDLEADRALLEALRQTLAPKVTFETLDMHINDPEFAAACVAALVRNIDIKEAANAEDHAHG
ncbi:hypothetical protein GCM10007989_21110 [Devosia pacifica]|uniref:Uncharacterized protein n=1 Tax=Devosia pacifica TaxID=1335967 RepID=A0A918S5J2_9HYPH|nr:Tm-1-like ATP-binding domain-containing protein [Devosia pacifica]GHA25209.1 hypothetical protein GCM10007989_21110 [Devosia pacifica]